MHGSIDRGNEQDLLIIELFISVPFKCSVFGHVYKAIYISLLTTNKFVFSLHNFYYIIHIATFQ